MEAINEAIEALEDVHTYFHPNNEPQHKVWSDTYKALKSLQAYKEGQGWQPIETAPNDGTEIIITNGYEVCTGKYHWSNVTNYAPFFVQSVNGELRNQGYNCKVEPVYFYEPTHWMPLPEKPNTIIKGE